MLLHVASGTLSPLTQPGLPLVPDRGQKWAKKTWKSSLCAGGVGAGGATAHAAAL